MDRSFLLKLVLLIAIMILLGNTVAISRDYEDGCVLEGLELSFVLFVVIYALTFFSEEKVSSMVLLAVVGRVTFLLIPNLKYDWFLGTAIDQHVQYGLANYVVAEGYITTQGPSTVPVYGSTPFIHLTFAIFSIVLNMPVVDSIKFLPVFLSPVYPLLTYSIMKKFEFSRGTNVLKYAVFISSVPISGQNFIVTGSQFGVLIAFLILASLVMFLQKEDLRHFSIVMFLTFALAAAHSASSLLLIMFLLSIMLLQKISYFRLKSYLKTPQIFAATLICVVWLYFPAARAFEKITRLIFVGALGGTTPQAEQIAPRFFDLVYADILAAIKILLASYGARIFLLLLTLSSLIILLKRLKQLDTTSKFLFLMCGVALLSTPFALLSKLGLFRVLFFLTPLFPIFAGIFIVHASKRRRWLMPVIFSLVVLLAPFQLYHCQPLIPSANVLKKDLPASEPIVYVTCVNSIYQRQMIGFASKYCRGGIACDRTTKEQIVGLTDFSFSLSYIKGYYPLDKRQLEKRYDYFLIHLPGISGPFNEQAEVRTRDLILGAIYNSSVIYTNGESYALTHPPL